MYVELERDVVDDPVVDSTMISGVMTADETRADVLVVSTFVVFVVMKTGDILEVIGTVELAGEDVIPIISAFIIESWNF